MSIFSHFQQRFESTRQEEYSLQEYLDLCKADPGTYASAAERLVLVEQLPRNPVGKVLKKDLRARYWQGVSRQI